MPLTPTSRYFNIGTSSLYVGSGRTLIYLRRRFVPAPERFAVVDEHVVVQGDRLDNVTARYLGDPEQFWLVSDANRAMRPDDLTAEIGRRLRITLPEGIP